MLGGVTVTVAQALLTSPLDSAYLFYGMLIVILVARVRRPMRTLTADEMQVLAAYYGTRASAPEPGGVASR